MSNFSLNFWCVCLLSVPLPEWQEKKTLNSVPNDVSASFFIYNFNLFDGLHTISKLDNQQIQSDRIHLIPTHNTRKHYYVWLPLSTATHNLKQKTRRKYIFAFLSGKWKISLISHLYVGCCGVNGIWSKTIESTITTILRNGFNLFQPSQMANGKESNCRMWAHDFDLI